MLLSFLAPFLLLSTSLASAYKPINPELPVAREAQPLSLRAAPVLSERIRPRTNGERLARGLPPLKPRFSRSFVPGRRNKEGPTPAVRARGQPSGVADTPITVHGHILAFDLDSLQQIGFIRAIPNSFGEYGLTNDPLASLQVTFTYSTAQHTTLDIVAEQSVARQNGPLSGTFQFVGGAVGFASTSDDLGPGSFNYAFVAGTGQTSPNSPPANVGNSFSAVTSIPKNSESAVWSFDPVTLAITPQWVNTDLSHPKTIIVYTQDVLLFTGDFTAFVNIFGPSRHLSLTFVPL